MLTEKSIKQLVSIALVVVILFFTFLLIKPIAIAIIIGLVLAYIFDPIDKFILKYVKNRTVTSSITCLIMLLIIFALFWFLIPMLSNQVFSAYSSLQQWDMVSALQKVFPFLFTSEEISTSVMASYNNFVANSVNVIFKKLTSYLVDLPELLLKILVVLIVFFYALRDGDKLLKLLRDILPFSREITNKFIRKSKETTYSVVFGRFITGFITGVLTGASFFLAGISNSLLLTFLAIIAAIIPIIGPWAIWVPIVVGLYIAGETLTATLLLVYCALFISFIDNILHAAIISRKVHVPTSVTLLGIIGGIFVFGIVGLILGPLIVAYLLALMEIYRDYNLKTKS
jgi:predicted PurR-regulated permease PerM